MDLTGEERAILRGERGAAARLALEMQVQVGEFFGARRFVPVTNAHMMGDMVGYGERWLRIPAADRIARRPLRGF